MEHHSLLSLMIVVTIAFFLPILLHKLKLQAMPLVVAEIVAGLIIGKSGFNLVKEDPILTLLSLLGFIFLMFLSGVEIDFTIFGGKGGGRRANRRRFFHPLYVSLFIFILILGLSYVLSEALVVMELVEDPYLMTIMIATISLGVVVPVLKEKRMLENELGQTLLLISVIADFVTIVLLAVYISLLSGSIASMLLLLLFFVLVIATYLAIRRWSGDGLFRLLGSGTVQIGTRAVFALILFFVVMSETLGAENILGAFLAGVIVSLIAPKKTFIRQLDSFGYGFLIPIFFVMVGANMDLWGLFADWRIIVLIPVLLLFILLSKLVPTLILRFWFSWRETLGSGMLIASTLSLVIAAATIAHELGMIDDAMQGALVLVAVLSCLIFPILFNRIFPEQQAERKTRVAIVGANHITLPVVQALSRHSGYDVQLFSTDSREKMEGQFPSGTQESRLGGLTAQAELEQAGLAGQQEQSGLERADSAGLEGQAGTHGSKGLAGKVEAGQEQSRQDRTVEEAGQDRTVEQAGQHQPERQVRSDRAGSSPVQKEGKWSAVKVTSLDQEDLEAGGTYEADTVVLGTNDDERNVILARYAKARGVRRIIVRVEEPAFQEQARNEGFTVFSTLFASTSLLRAAIENPGVVDFIADQPGALVEVAVDNPRWDGTLLRNLPHLEGLLILRIYRGDSFLIPHGNTQILLGDRLLVSGEDEAVDRLRRNLS